MHLRNYGLMALLSLALLLALAGCGGSAGPTGPLQVNLTTNPNPPGASLTTFTVTVHDGQGQPVDGAAVTITAVHPTMGHGGPNGALTGQGQGTYAARGTFAMMGTWKVTISVTKTGFDPATKDFDVNVQ